MGSNRVSHLLSEREVKGEKKCENRRFENSEKKSKYGG